MICITAIFGPRDHVKPPPPCPSMLFTDDPALAEHATSLGWFTTLRRLPDKRLYDNRTLAKSYKCTPHVHGFKERDVLWLDGSIATKDHVKSADLDALFDLVPKGGVGAFRHRTSKTLAEEFFKTSSEQAERYADQPLDEQRVHYERAGLLDALRVYENGIVVWRGAQFSLGERWAAEQLAWTNQDQLSFPVAAFYTVQTITLLEPGDVIENPWFRFKDHRP